MVKREQGFKKKHRHGLYYHQLLSSSQFFPQCPSFCMTLMWLVRYDSYHRIYTNNQITKVSSRQISQDSRICSGWTSENRIFTPSSPKSVWDWLSTTMFVAISPPTLRLHPFFCTKMFCSNKSSVDCSNITALVLHNMLLQHVFKCDSAKKVVLLHNVLGKRIQDTTGGTLVMDNANFLQWLWRTLVFGRVQRLVCLKRRTRCARVKLHLLLIFSFCCAVIVR